MTWYMNSLVYFPPLVTGGAIGKGLSGAIEQTEKKKRLI
jgi:hypothetical protein